MKLPTEGDERGAWTVIRLYEKSSRRGHWKYLCRCRCGAIRPVRLETLHHGRKKCLHTGGKRRALIDSVTRFEEDPRSRYVVAHHPDGLSLDEIGMLFGITRERVRQIEVIALTKLRKRYPHFEEVLRQLMAQRDRRETTLPPPPPIFGQEDYKRIRKNAAKSTHPQNPNTGRGRR